MAKSLTELLEAGKKKASSNNFMRTVKPKQGKSVWRILPGWKKGDPTFFHAFGQHYIKDLDGKIKVVIGCPDKTFDEECEICEMISEAARKAPDDKTRNLILESRSTQRWLFNALCRDGEDPEKPVILEVGNGLFNDILAQIEENEDILDPAKGQDIVITRDGTGLSTRYSIALRSAAKSPAVPKSALMEMHDLEEHVKDDFEGKKAKAIKALGLTAGALLGGSETAGALAAPDIDLSEELDDDIPTYGDDDIEKAAQAELKAEVEDADVEYDSTPESSEPETGNFGDDVTDEDIESLLSEL